MLKAYCDRCEKEITMHRAYNQKVRIELPWSIEKFHLCEDCESSFCEWAGIDKERLVDRPEPQF